jgi:hypothetical protein
MSTFNPINQAFNWPSVLLSKPLVHFSYLASNLVFLLYSTVTYLTSPQRSFGLPHERVQLLGIAYSDPKEVCYTTASIRKIILFAVVRPSAIGTLV